MAFVVFVTLYSLVSILVFGLIYIPVTRLVIADSNIACFNGNR